MKWATIVSVNGFQIEIEFALTEELIQDRDAKIAYVESVVQREVAFKAEQRWGPGKLVKKRPAVYQWIERNEETS